MSDTVFKTREEVKQIEEAKPEVKTGPAPISSDNIEVPYTDAKDFLDKYFGIGTEWHDRDANFYPEVQTIDRYIKAKIDAGEISNDQKAVRGLLAGMEKLNNLKNESRSVVKLEILKNYIEFMMKNDSLKSNLRRYAN